MYCFHDFLVRVNMAKIAADAPAIMARDAANASPCLA
jgi:hypothetical protein